MLLDGVKERVVGSLVERFLKNSGVKDIIDHPQRYETTLTFEHDGLTVKIKRKES